MVIETSERGRNMPASPIRKLMPLADQARARGLRVFHLNIGQPDLETPLAMRSRLAHTPSVLAYTPSAGTPECLAVLSRYYRAQGIEVGTDEIITTTGGSEAVLFAFMACADSGDDVLLAEPFYTNYATFAAMAGLRLVPLRTRGEDGFHLPPADEWRAALTPRTRLVLVSNPNNPTGTVYRQEELERVASFCREHDLFLVGDEVYREFVYDGRTTTSILNLRGVEDRTVLVDSLSKRYSACGIRLGCVATRNRDLYAAMLRMAQGRLSPPGLAQLAALGIGELGPEHGEAVRAEYQARRDVLYDGLSQIPGVFLRKPEGAFYFIARLPIKDAEDFAAWLLSDFSFEGGTVMVAPAQGFYASRELGHDEVRIAYVLNRRDLETAIRILARAIPAYAAVRAPAHAGR